MKTILKITIFAFFSASVFVGCGKPNLQTPTKQEIKEVKKIAKKAIKKVGGATKKAMKKTMKKQGVVAAAKFCSLKASKIVAKANKKLPKGVSVRKISTKYRNPNAKPTSLDEDVLAQFEEAIKNKKKPKMIVLKLSDTHFKVYKPVIIGGKCLLCHGDKEARNSKAYEVIKKHYPHDKAIDYKLGDLRGAFLVDIIKEKKTSK